MTTFSPIDALKNFNKLEKNSEISDELYIANENETFCDVNMDLLETMPTSQK